MARIVSLAFSPSPDCVRRRQYREIPVPKLGILGVARDH